MKLITGITFCIITVFPMLCYSADHGADHHDHGMKKELSAVESLSPGLRKLLTDEMFALQSGMMDVIPAFVSGNWSEVEHIATKMKNSYIMKQKITPEQVKELHSSLPEAFVKQDQEFHYLAGMLSHAAKNRKKELVAFYFSRMGESCLNCHAQFAKHKFAGFKGLKEKTHNNHH